MIDYPNRRYFYPTLYQEHLNKISTIFLVICLVLSFIFMGFSVIFYPAIVNGPSMQPTINEEWSISNDKRDYVYATTFASPKINDIIIADTQDDTDVIKRLIAKENDLVTIFNNKILVNNKEINQNYLPSETLTNYTLNNIAHNYTTWEYGAETVNINLVDLTIESVSFTVPENCCFYLGDNRAVSNDCSYYGPQLSSCIKGKVSFIVPYDLNIIQYFWARFYKLFY